MVKRIQNLNWLIKLTILKLATGNNNCFTFLTEKILFLQKVEQCNIFKFLNALIIFYSISKKLLNLDFQ